MLWRLQEGAWGSAPLAWVWGVQGCALLHAPTARPLGRVAGAHYQLAVDAGGAACGPLTDPHRARSYELALRTMGATRGRPGELFLPWCGASGVGRSATLTARPLGRAAGAHYLLAVGAWLAGIGTRQQPHSARSGELAFRAVEAA